MIMDSNGDFHGPLPFGVIKHDRKERFEWENLRPTLGGFSSKPFLIARGYLEWM
jgi:hypothetical protein